jgi:hypothetical protein
MANLCLTYIQSKLGFINKAENHLATCHEHYATGGWEKYMKIMGITLPSSAYATSEAFEEKWAQ